MTRHKHPEKHFSSGQALRDIVIGMSDGLTVPFALAAGLSGASISNSVILTAGVAELVAGAVSMGLGGYLAGKSEVEHYQSEVKREAHEIAVLPMDEKSEIREILRKFGISPSTQKHFVNELAADPENWLRFMMEFELGLQKPDEKQVKWGALRIGSAYAFGGFIPLSAYAMTKSSQTGLYISATMTIIALGIFGYLKSQVLQQPRAKGTIRMVAVGALAAIVSFLVARLFSE